MEELTITKIKNKMGRPELKIDWKIADELIEAGCIGTEIASYFGIHPDTFYKRIEKEYNMGFSAYLQQKRAKGEAILRKTQYDLAVEGKDVRMLIWLGKQRLDQREPEPAPDKELAKGAFNLWGEQNVSKKKE